MGTAKLYRQYKGQISRRKYIQLVKEKRDMINKAEQQEMQRIEWRIPSACWAFDDTYYSKDENGNKMWIHNIKDLASQYILPPLAGEFKNGEEIARNLASIFIDYGAPLFLKADNGPNLNSKEVKEILKRFGVILVNSPEYYSKYNGSIENANGLIKKEIDRLAYEFKIKVNFSNIRPLARLAAHELNLRVKRSIKNRPVFLFHKYNDLNKIKTSTRKEVFHETMTLAQQMLDDIPEQKRALPSIIKKCKRKAAEKVLQNHGYIVIYKN